jgi:hypothetical protein
MSDCEALGVELKGIEPSASRVRFWQKTRKSRGKQKIASPRPPKRGPVTDGETNRRRPPWTDLAPSRPTGVAQRVRELFPAGVAGISADQLASWAERRPGLAAELAAALRASTPRVLAGGRR